MNNLEADIISLYEDEGMSVEDIGAELSDIDSAAIKMCLAQFSQKYRNIVVKKAIDKPTNTIVTTNSAPIGSIHNGDLLDVTERMRVKKVMMQLLDHSDNDGVRAKIAIYLNEEVTGRNEKRVKQNNMPNVQLSILQLNAHMLKAKQLVDDTMRAIGPSPMLIIDVK